MSRLTREERKELGRIVELEEIRVKKRNEETFNRIIGGVAILMILSVFPYVWFFQYIDFCLHKNQVQVDNVRMVEYGLNDSKGEYFIQFYVDIETGKEEATLVSFHTLVYKKGKFIGHINSDIPGPILKEDGTTQYSVFNTKTARTVFFNISGGNNLTEADELFCELYNGNPDDYTFEVNFMGVMFTDGTTVGHAYLQDYFDYQYDENGEIHFTDNYLSKQGYWWK